MLQAIGKAVKQKISFLSYSTGYFGKIIKSSFFFISRGKTSRKILVMQLLFTYIEALPIISILGVTIGTGIYLVGYNLLSSFGQEKLIYSLLVLIVTRELGPLLIAIVVTARSATAIASEIAGMVISHEIEAYISIGVDPINHLAVPRFLGVTGSVFFLNIYFSVFGLIAPIAIVQLFNPTPMAEYLNSILQVLTMETLFVSIIKSLVFGIIISVVSTLYGFNVERASTEIPQASLQAVGKSFLFIIIANVLLSILSYIL